MSYVLRRLTTQLILLWIASGTSLPQTRTQTTYHVATCGNDTWTGTSAACAGPGGPKATIQAAIIVAVNGDEVAVAPGTYNEAINLLGKTITVRGTDGPEVTIIDGVGLDTSVVTCTSGETAATVLEGFTITGGTGTVRDVFTLGGGMIVENSSPTVTDCIFTGNNLSLGGHAVRGGGMYNKNGSPTVTRCIFEENSASSGAGMFNIASSNPLVTNCSFTNNVGSAFGAGMYNEDSRPTVTDCTFSGNAMAVVPALGGGMHNLSSHPTVTNTSFSENSATSGGGMYNKLGSRPMVTGCSFTDNSTFDIVEHCLPFLDNGECSGGGMHNYSSRPVVTDRTFVGNTAFSGGGMYNTRGTGRPIITNCLFSGNQASYRGGGVCNIAISGTFSNCTFTENSADGRGGGMYGDDSGAEFVNCIFHANSAPFVGSQVYSDGLVVPVFGFCDIQGSGGSGVLPPPSEWYDIGLDAGGNIDADPLFVDPLGLDGLPGSGDENHHLLSGSPCLDAGLFHSGLPDTDLDGQPRIQQCRVDMGAYESPFFTDCDGGGAGDACEINADPFLDCDVDGVLDW